MTPNLPNRPENDPGAAMKLTQFGLAVIVLITLALAARLTTAHSTPATAPSTQTASQQ